MAFSIGAAPKPATGRRSCIKAHARATNSPQEPGMDRRDFLLALSTVAPLLGAAPAFASPDVGSYLPAYGSDDFVRFTPDRSKTPAIRAGTVDPSKPYTFAVPPSWSERKVANIASGNYCQPRCAEPWTEVIFADDSEGKLQVIVAPLVRLTNQKGATIQDIGDPEGFLNSIGSFITGTYLDQEDVVSMEAKTLEDGLTYYYYDIYATYGLQGPHTLTACTVKGDLALLYCLSATDKQWAKASKKLKKLLPTFRA